MTELLIKNGYLLTLDEQRRVITDGAVAVKDAQIMAVGKTSELEKEYGSYEVLDAGRMIVMPGLVNTHNHVFAMLSRGYNADGGRQDHRKKTRYSWDVSTLRDRNKDDCKAAGMLASLEMIKHGITTTQDSHYINFHLDSIDGVAESIQTSGMRIVLGRGSWDAPDLAPEDMTEDVDTAVRATRKVLDKWHGQAEGRITVRVEASMLAQCSDEMLVATKELADRHGLGWATHLQHRLATAGYDPRKGDESLRRYGGRSVEYLNNQGVLGPNSLLIHCTHVDNREISLLSKTNTPVAHCPLANAWGGNPVVAPVPQMHSHGVTVGLGTDSVVTNDSMDLFQVMKICTLLHKVNMGSTHAMTAEKVLKMGTIDAAKALTLDKTIGSLSPGKKADIILLNMDHPGLLPSISPVKNIVYGAGGGSAVDTVIVNGEFLMRDREMLTLNEKEVYSMAEEVGRSILTRGGRLGKGERHIHFGPWRYE